MRGSPERDISSLRAFGPGGGQIWGVVRVSARALLEYFEESHIWLTRNGTVLGKVAFGSSEAALFEEK